VKVALARGRHSCAGGRALIDFLGTNGPGTGLFSFFLSSLLEDFQYDVQLKMKNGKLDRK
jgi:hypothetical protein